MFRQSILLILVFFVILSSIIIGKQNVTNQNNREDTIGNNFIVNITAVNKDGVEQDQFKEGEAIHAKVFVTYIGGKSLTIPKGNDWNKPQLIMDQKIIQYREDIMRAIKEKEKSNIFIASGLTVLEPNKLDEDIIEITNWYEPLKVGQYQLSLQRIFFGVRVESNTVSFEIVS